MASRAQRAKEQRQEEEEEEKAEEKARAEIEGAVIMAITGRLDVSGVSSY